MRNVFVTILICVLMFSSPTLYSQSSDDSKVRREIEHRYAEYIKSFGEADAGGVADLYEENGSRLSKGSKVQGRGKIKDNLESWFKRVGPVQVSIDIAALWVVDDQVYETGEWTYTYEPADQDRRTIGGRYFTIWKRQKDKSWKMLVDAGLPDQ